jgi:hypothetical protein
VRQEASNVVVGAFGRNMSANYQISQDEALSNALTFLVGLHISKERPIVFSPMMWAVLIGYRLKEMHTNVRVGKKRARR